MYLPIAPSAEIRNDVMVLIWSKLVPASEVFGRAGASVWSPTKTKTPTYKPAFLTALRSQKCYVIFNHFSGNYSRPVTDEFLCAIT